MNAKIVAFNNILKSLTMSCKATEVSWAKANHRATLSWEENVRMMKESMSVDKTETQWDQWAAN
jgi:hypothetical protein